MNELFRKIAHHTARVAGSPRAFTFAVLSVLIWAILGPHYNYSDTWQLVINTGTTVLTFLMIFLVQNTQNRDAKAMHLKLDELIRASKTSRNQLIDLEELSDEEMELLHGQFQRLHEKAAKRHEKSVAKRA